jgi:hypothetical protein
VLLSEVKESPRNFDRVNPYYEQAKASEGRLERNMPVIIFFAFLNEANWVALRRTPHPKELSEAITF